MEPRQEDSDGTALPLEPREITKAHHGEHEYCRRDVESPLDEVALVRKVFQPLKMTHCVTVTLYSNPPAGTSGRTP